MDCPKCLTQKTKVTDTRYFESLETPVDDVMRIRICKACKYRFWTQEKFLKTLNGVEKDFLRHIETVQSSQKGYKD